MSTERQIALSTGGRYTAIAISTVIGFVLTPYLIHAIGVMAYGLQALSTQTIQIVSLAATAIGVSYERHAAAHYARKEFDRMNTILSVGLQLSLISASLLLAGALVSALYAKSFFDLPDELVHDARLVLAITGFAAACHIVYGVWKSPLFITQRFYLESLGQILATIGAAVGVVLIFNWHHPSIITWVLLACGLRVLLEWCCVIPLCRRALPEMHVTLRNTASRAQFVSILSFGGLTFLAGIGALLYYACDSIIIANLDSLGIGQVTYYSVAQRWDPQIRMVITAFGGVLTPLMTADAAVGNLDRLRNTVLRGSRYALILALYPSIVLGVFAVPFFHLWLGPEFSEASVPVLRVILVGLVASVPGIIAYQALTALGQLKWAAVTTLAAGVLNIVLAIVLVRFAHLGLVGVAIASASAIIIVHAVCFPIILSRAAALPVTTLGLHGALRALLGGLPLLAFGLAIHQIWHARNLMELMLQFAVCGLFYAASVWTISLTSEDRRKVRSALATLPGLKSRAPR